MTSDYTSIGTVTLKWCWKIKEEEQMSMQGVAPSVPDTAASEPHELFNIEKENPLNNTHLTITSQNRSSPAYFVTSNRSSIKSINPKPLLEECIQPSAKKVTKLELKDWFSKQIEESKNKTNEAQKSKDKKRDSEWDILDNLDSSIDGSSPIKLRSKTDKHSQKSALFDSTIPKIEPDSMQDGI